jgi:hypothetical protein
VYPLEVFVFSSCLVCSAPFPENDSLEHFRVGERVAYDPSKGRLWAVCRKCKRWTLAPIEERWEALDEIEKIVRDKAKLLSQTDNVAFLKAGELEIVRVGRADLTEEAWWRYGRQLVDRRKRHRKLTTLASVGVGAAIVLGPGAGIGWFGGWMLWNNAPQGMVNAARWLRFGGAGWRGKRQCADCGEPFKEIQYRDRARVIVRPASEDSPLSLTQRCPRCRGASKGAGLLLEGRDAEKALQRLLAYHHHSGASENRISSATRLIEAAGSAERLTQLVLKDGTRMGDLGRTGGIALEIAANQAREQRLLELELADLEAHWRREEELAEIIDGELTDVPVIETLRRRISGVGA